MQFTAATPGYEPGDSSSSEVPDVQAVDQNVTYALTDNMESSTIVGDEKESHGRPRSSIHRTPIYEELDDREYFISRLL
jgi:hypothetical protein